MSKKRQKVSKVLIGFGVTFLLLGVFALSIIFTPSLLKQPGLSSPVSPITSALSIFKRRNRNVGPSSKGIQYLKEFNLKIDKLNINVPVAPQVDGYNQATYFEALKSGVAHFKGTALPNEVGNTVIFGHSSGLPWIPGEYKDTFASLDELEKDDEINLIYKNKVFNYLITEKKVVAPDDFTVLTQTNKPRLTLMTCYPFGLNAQRLVVVAELKN